MKNETQAKFVAAPRQSAVFLANQSTALCRGRRYTENYEH